MRELTDKDIFEEVKRLIKSRTDTLLDEKKRLKAEHIGRETGVSPSNPFVKKEVKQSYFSSDTAQEEAIQELLDEGEITLQEVKRFRYNKMIRRQSTRGLKREA